MQTNKTQNSQAVSSPGTNARPKEVADWQHKLSEVWLEWRTLIIFLIVMVLFRSAIADWNQVPSGSMKPTILEGDRIVVNKLAYDLKIPFTTWHLAEWSVPKRGEIVTFYSPDDEKLLIKRVIGIPGDVIRMRDNQLYINGEPATYDRLDASIVNQLDYYQRRTHSFFNEKYQEVEHAVMLRAAAPNEYNSFGPIEIPAGQYMMLGDNRDNSRDSRRIGLVSRDRITGRAHTVAFSVDYEEYYMPRIDRFLRPLN
ncbi:MAG: signal peptidase I [bacterium]|nr:signal peptidase I [Gammaproteobacteria bacterium]HIL98648.1 signal peptidase I [Pseudomonadales bacterium]